MRKTSTEISTVDVELLLPWNVNVLTSRAVYLDPGCWQVFGDSDGKNVLAFAKHSWTISERT